MWEQLLTGVHAVPRAGSGWGRRRCHALAFSLLFMLAVAFSESADLILKTSLARFQDDAAREPSV